MVPVAVKQQVVVQRGRRLVRAERSTARLMVVKRVSPSVCHSFAVLAMGIPLFVMSILLLMLETWNCSRIILR
jgi:hypothetical protein